MASSRASVAASPGLAAGLVSVAIALGAWFAMRAIDPSGRMATLAALLVIGVASTGLYLLAMQLRRGSIAVKAPA